MNEGCAEPTLDDLLSDSAMWLLMRRDGVEESDLRVLLGAVARRTAPAGISGN
jgi:hypothetical protein